MDRANGRPSIDSPITEAAFVSCATTAVVCEGNKQFHPSGTYYQVSVPNTEQKPAFIGKAVLVSDDQIPLCKETSQNSPPYNKRINPASMGTVAQVCSAGMLSCILDAADTCSCVVH
jgi:hypothetical protein